MKFARYKKTKLYKNILYSKMMRRLLLILNDRKKIQTEKMDFDSPWNYLTSKNLGYYYDRINVWSSKKTGSRMSGENLFEKTSFRVFDNNKIAIIVEWLSSRCCKICNALKQKGYYLEVYCAAGISNEFHDEELLKILSDTWIEWTNAGDLMSELVESSAFVAHYFLRWDDAGNACVLLKHKDWFMPICVESYDVLNGMYNNILPTSLKRERFAYENAAGVIFRDLSGKYLESKLGFRIKRQLIFLDGIDEADVIDDVSEDTSRTDDELHLVYVGSIFTKNVNFGSPFACLDDLAGKCEKNRCHLHIYPAGCSARQREDLDEIITYNRFFHLHEPVPHSELIHEISRYDFGIHHSTSQVFSSNSGGIHTKEKNIYASANKIFDYLAAGLPIISAVCVEFGKIFEKQGMLLPWTIEQYDFDLLRERRRELKENVKKNREIFYLSNSMKKLKKFYEEISVGRRSE